MWPFHSQHVLAGPVSVRCIGCGVSASDALTVKFGPRCEPGTTPGLFGNTFPGAPVSNAWPAQHLALYMIIASLVIIAIFAPLAVAMYRRGASL